MIISIHHYELAESATDQEFHDAVREADRRGLFDLPGLDEYRFLRGIKGTRKDGYTALWMYDSREAWQNLWGSNEDPVSQEEYPDKWNQWEEELLAPLIAGDPDDIDYTSYEVIDSSDGR
jgi:hypothetical protein